MNKKNLILVDENNFFFRCFWSQKLTVNDKRIEIVYAIFRNLRYMIESIRKETGVNTENVILCGDRGYRRRLEYSKQAVNEHIINCTYKSKRRIDHKLKQAVMSDEELAEEQSKKEQLEIFDELIKKTRFQRVFFGGEEADDVIASYVHKYKNDYNIYIVSSDGDYQQLLDDNVTIFNSHKGIFYTKQNFIDDYGFDPKYFADYGAIIGDGGDSIIGVCGFGPAKAKPFIQKYKTIEVLLDELINMNPTLYNEMKKYKHFDDFRVNVKQTTWSLMEARLVFNDKLLRVAKYLKKMFVDLDVPEPCDQDSHEQQLEYEFKELKFLTLVRFVDYFVKSDVDENKIKRLLKVNNKPYLFFQCEECGKEYMFTNADEAETCSCGGKLTRKIQSFIEQTKFF